MFTQRRAPSNLHSLPSVGALLLLTALYGGCGGSSSADRRKGHASGVSSQDASGVLGQAPGTSPSSDTSLSTSIVIGGQSGDDDGSDDALSGTGSNGDTTSDGGTDSGTPTDSGGTPLKPTSGQWGIPKYPPFAPSRFLGASIWTGDKWLIWGGLNTVGNRAYADGGLYSPATDSWTPVSDTGAPAPRESFGAVWTGSSLIVMGGAGAPFSYESAFKDAYKYTPATRTWTKLAAKDFQGCIRCTAFWTGSQIILLGHTSPEHPSTAPRAVYDADMNLVRQLPAPPDGLVYEEFAMVGGLVYAWGGLTADGNKTSRGFAYDPAENKWTEMSLTGAPAPRTGAMLVPAGTKLIVFGGGISNGVGEPYGDGGIYDPATAQWTAIPAYVGKKARDLPGAVWTGTSLILWSGRTYEQGIRYHTDGVSYTPGSGWSDLPDLVDKHAYLNYGAGVVGHYMPYTIWTGTALGIFGGQQSDSAGAAINAFLFP
jgi:hypothetical protein